MTIVNIKQNDTKGIFTDTLLVDGLPVDLTGTTVYFILRKVEVFVRQVAVIVGLATAGNVQYQPIAVDVGTAGQFEQEWEVKWPDGKLLTFPNGGYNIVNILDDLDSPDPI